MRANSHSFWRRSSRRTAIKSSLRRRLSLDSQTWSNKRWSFLILARFKACTVWIASMLGFLPFCNGLRFLLLTLVPTMTQRLEGVVAVAGWSDHLVVPFSSVVLRRREKNGARIADKLMLQSWLRSLCFSMFNV